ncbi:MAG: serine/threonine-protein kinase [Myxococcaceae bacterium]
MADRRFGNYEILAKLGRGGMAEVYRARVLTGQREGWSVALKRLLPSLSHDPAALEQFAREADLSRALDHPNIVSVYEVGKIQDISFIAMELVDGRDLAQILRRCKQSNIPLPIDFAVFLAKVLADALAHAHNAKGANRKPLGLVHCDVSPSNLFISRVGDVKLGDFGVARARGKGNAAQDLAGKPHYLSPEALSGKITHDADLWAAVVTLYELLTLERPFAGEEPEEVFAAVKAGDYLPVRERRPEISEGLAEVIDRGFHSKQKKRFATAAELSDALVPHYDELVGTPLAIASVVRGLFGSAANQ